MTVPCCLAPDRDADDCTSCEGSTTSTRLLSGLRCDRRMIFVFGLISSNELSGCNSMKIDVSRNSERYRPFSRVAISLSTSAVGAIVFVPPARAVVARNCQRRDPSLALVDAICVLEVHFAVRIRSLLTIELYPTNLLASSCARIVWRR